MAPHVYLIADDDSATRLLIERAFKQLNIEAALQFVTDGSEAIDYLKGEGRFSDRQIFPLPTLLLLDVKMPNTDGFDVLRWLREADLHNLVVVMFSSSTIAEDVQQAYRLGANSYLEKPVSYARLLETLAGVHHYWNELNCAAQMRAPGAPLASPRPIQ